MEVKLQKKDCSDFHEYPCKFYGKIFHLFKQKFNSSKNCDKFKQSSIFPLSYLELILTAWNAGSIFSVDPFFSQNNNFYSWPHISRSFPTSLLNCVGVISEIKEKSRLGPKRLFVARKNFLLQQVFFVGGFLSVYISIIWQVAREQGDDTEKTVENFKGTICFRSNVNT